MEALHSICAVCTANPLLLRICSRALRHSLLGPAELLACLISPSDDSDVYYR